MTDYFDKPKKYEGEKLTPYPHVEKGVERGRALDPVGYFHDVEQRARERQVAIETVKILRRHLVECVRKEGVNHYENCQEQAKAYIDQISMKDYGQLQPKWENPEMNDGWA